MLDAYIKYVRYLAVFTIVGMIFYGGCTSTSNVTHEAAGIVIPSVSPSVSTLTSAETEEAEIVKNGKFSTVTVTFQNLNAIPVTLKYYKVEYQDGYNGEKIGSLSFGADLAQTIPGSTAGTSATAATTATTPTTATTGSTASASGNSITLSVVNQKVKNEMYRVLTDSTDNRILTAKITFYGIDYNANGLELNASVTIVP
ncbi:MAG: hypothetical protein A2008_01675 [Candidatus Wallbacteria bacterium GWC2_49_35]|uniref:Uncharacterized protein n=1 Tax=Candidatus Wallbacteria bacterium GWC2_49_35 TaxID=1817813 RepID=A0A1F7WSU8_9BACT|nr:MAG: hypothetical protein A2008_01675 [Candidatus Wallbacteria bacterium GWC2_49_35]HBC76503.1 hypothetical protein [Candidatus Wallbacteria bacterium]